MATTLAISIVAISAGLVSLRSDGNPRAAWRWLSVAAFAWASGHLPAALAGAHHGLAVVGSLAGRAVFVAASAVALALLLRDQPRGRESMLDGLAIAIAVVNIAVVLPVNPLTHVGSGDGAAIPALATQIGLVSLALLATIGLAWGGGAPRDALFALLFVGFLLPAVGLVGASRADRIPDSSNPALAAGWVGAFLCIGLAARAARRPHVPLADARPPETRALRRLASAGAVAVALQTVAAASVAGAPERNWFVIVSVAALGGLLALRLGLAAQQADRLALRTRERDQLAAILELSGTIGAAPETHSLLAHLAEASARAADCPCAEAVVRDATGRMEVASHGAADWDDREHGAASQLLDLLRELGSSANAVTPFRLAADDRRLPPSVRAVWLARRRLVAAVAPLPVDGALVGYVATWRPDAPPHGRPDELTALAAIARHGSVALQSAWLLARERALAEERAMLLRVSRAGTSSLELYDVLREMADATIGIAGIECTAIEIWRPDTDELEIGAQVTVPEWPDVDPPGTRYPVGYWELDRTLLSSREPVSVDRDDPNLDEESRRRMRAAGTGSMLVVPVWLGDRCLGLADFFSRQGNAFGEDAIRVGREIAHHVALAINNALHHDAERRRAEERAILLRVSRAATSSLDLHTVLAEVTEAGLGIPGAESCSVVLWESDAPETVLAAESVVPDWPGIDPPGTRYPIHPGSRYLAIRSTDEPFVLDTATDSVADDDVRELLQYGAASAAVFPLWIGDAPIGALELYSRCNGAFSSDSLRLGVEIATQTALAIRNAQLLAETRRVAEEQAALLRVGRTVSSGASLDRIAADVCANTRSLGPFDGCEVVILQEESSEIAVVGRDCVDGWPLNITPIGQSLSLDRWPAMRRLIERGAPVMLDQETPGLLDSERSQLLGADPRAATFAVPLVIGEQASGLLTVFASRRDAFTDHARRLIADIAGQVALAVERERLTARLELQATTDGLTGLLNHRTVLERLDHELNVAERRDLPVSIIMLDLDRFKEINDTHGHSQGDHVLREVADTLKSSVRSIDHVGRYGGDEFLVILPGADAIEALAVAERIRFAVDSMRVGRQADLPITLSAGVAAFPSMALTRQDLCELADGAMYRAKLQRQRQSGVPTPMGAVAD